jgi:hypothetical protein
MTGAVGAVEACAHIAIGENVSIRHDNGLRADRAHIDAHGDKSGIIPTDIRILPVGLGPVPVFGSGFFSHSLFLQINNLFGRL